MEIHGSVVDNYLMDTSKTDTPGEIFTSSDTVNELIKGFSDQNFDKSQDLNETTHILPSFTKVLTSFSHQGIEQHTPPPPPLFFFLLGMYFIL